MPRSPHRPTPQGAPFVERELGRLKYEYGLAFLRVRGIERLRLHADLVQLGASTSRSREPFRLRRKF